MKRAPLQSRVSESELLDRILATLAQAIGWSFRPKDPGQAWAQIRRRCSELCLPGPEDYLHFLSEHSIDESRKLLSVLTTHHTYFFREFFHFEYLEREGLERLLQSLRESKRNVLRVWSAACSYGHEVYSLSLFLRRQLAEMAPDIDYEIWGTDVDEAVIKVAKNGVYRWKELKTVPAAYLGDHWVRGTEDISHFVKAKPSIKSRCHFLVENLVHPSDALAGPFDIVFCRNVFIYFNETETRQAIDQIVKRMSPRGLLFIGISESIRGLDLPLTFVSPSIYVPMQSTGATKTAFARIPVPAPAPAPTTGPRKAIRVLCVDDSPTILVLLKRILAAETGFEVVATAADGIEAEAVLARTEVDVITLDLQMPKKDGLQFLHDNAGRNLPPIVVVSSVPRESASLAIEALECGAADYVEKPSLSRLTESAEELRSKIRSALSHRGQNRRPLFLERQFSADEEISDPKEKLRLVVAGVGDLERAAQVLGALGGPQPPTVVLVPGAPDLIEALARRMEIRGHWVEPLAAQVESGRVYMGDFASCFPALASRYRGRKATAIVLGDVSGSVGDSLSAWAGLGLFLEELALEPSAARLRLIAAATDVVPAVSLLGRTSTFLGRDDNED